MNAALQWIGIILVLFVNVASLAQDTNAISGDAKGANKTSLMGIIWIDEEKWWSLEELSAKGLEFLRKEGAMKGTENPNVTATIYPLDKDKMCRFSYTQGFGRPLWIVEFDHNGNVFNHRKGVMMEGGRGGPNPGFPKNGQLPKGAKVVPPK